MHSYLTSRDSTPPPKPSNFDSTPQTAQHHYESDSKAKELDKLVQQINDGYFTQEQLAQLTHAIEASQPCRATLNPYN